MKHSSHWLLSGLLVISSGMGALHADTLAMDVDTIERLGIETAQPKAVSTSGGAAYPGLVVIPPGQERRAGFTESARILSLQVALGDLVKKGQSLATATSPQLVGLQRDYLQAKLALNLARQQYQRDKELEAEGIIAVRRLQETRNNLDNQRIVTEQQASMLKMNGFSSKDIKALAQSGKLKTEVSLRAPIDGIVLEIPSSVGEMLEMGQAVVRLADLSRLWFEIRVPLSLADEISEGAVVTLLSRQITGTVERISRQVDAASQTVVVRASVSEGTDSLRPGEAVEVRIGDSSESRLSVPRAAVIHSEEKNWVFVLSENGFEVTSVELAGYSGTAALIRSGLKDKDVVAVKGIAALKGAWMGIGGGE